MNTSQVLHDLKHSIWFDNIDRELLKSGWFKEQIKKRAFFGVTSNPSIFKNSIANGTDYTLDIQTMSWSGLDTISIYENLVLDDIREVADLLQPIYKETEEIDGYVSLEVNPKLANDKDSTIEEAKRLWKLVDRKNLMIKIPATLAGIFAIRELIAEGININVTLIFSTDRYLEVIEAYFSGLEKRINMDLSIENIHSVASFFISRLDVKIENKVMAKVGNGELGIKSVNHLLGKIGIQNALFAYSEFEKSIQLERFAKIKEKGGNIQRPLWASTGTKNPQYSDVLYVDGLILPHTVNTVPPETLKALMDHGKSELIENLSPIEKYKDLQGQLEEKGIDYKVVFNELEEEGVEKFASAQSSLLETIENERVCHLETLKSHKPNLKDRISHLKNENFILRFNQLDSSLFTQKADEAEEVLHRLGWMDAPIAGHEIVGNAEELLGRLTKEGYTHAVVLGMGGSSLAPEVFSQVFQHAEDRKQGLDLSILDSTDPLQVQAKVDVLPLEKTLFIASSKSGTTAEMKSLVVLFLELMEKQGVENPANHFIAITDPETALEKFAVENNFRQVFSADPNVGGRYSAMIAFGIVPAVLSGVDGGKLLANANQMRVKCGPNSAIERNPAVILAAILVEAYQAGLDKLTILADDKYLSIGSWLEQLVAESSGKEGKGLIPIDSEPIASPEEYSKDRIFYYLRNNGKYDDLVSGLQEEGFIVLSSNIDDLYDIASEMYKWEFAVASFCSMINVNPFNQPNVQASKSLTIKMIEGYKQKPAFDEDDVLFSDERVTLFGKMQIDTVDKSVRTTINEFLAVKRGDFIAVNAFLPRISSYEKLLSDFRRYLLETYSVPVTQGFGPRFLHSTGQLHKGGKNNGKFLVFTQESEYDIEIPGEGISFSVLEKAQALGDMRALETLDRQVLRIHFKKELKTENIAKRLFG